MPRRSVRLRTGPKRPDLAPRDIPLEQRVDKYGQRQLAGTGRARRAEGRADAEAAYDDPEDTPGWWKLKPNGAWTYHGNGAVPGPAQ